MIKLIGILVIIVGFALKLDTISIVLLAGIITGIVSGMGIIEILSFLGNAFVANRFATLLVLTLATIGILERNGLRERATKCIMGIRGATCGKILSLYVIIRTIASALSIRIGGHVNFIRPLIYPMARGALEKYGIYDKQLDEKVKAISNSVENYGNFFGQNVFIASAGVLLVLSTLQELGIKNVDAYSIAISSIPMAIVAMIVSVIRNYLFDLKLKKLIDSLKENKN
ncbi:DUF969 domain-containing protein [Brachyspira pilosicoli]|uniref:DUF969 domain-containing protein n=1 Tax=Brachyspira pilosicoli TaxID=52584 RepID=A0A5C8ENG0_BRAPL|nr:DUF969 domain-containing protein [Brachyspira pilosicoli]TXJ39365.1 DUF969 domain-containing protein [Brachyspira pilosicoli]